MQDAMLQYIRLALAAQGKRGGPIARAGDQSVSGGNPPCGIFPCKGGGPNDYVYVYTSRTNPEHWRRLLGVLGREDLLGDLRFATPIAREEHTEQINEMVADWTRKQDKHEAMRRLGSAGIPAGAVLDTLELDQDVTFAQRGILQQVTHPDGHAFRMPTWPVRHDGATAAVTAAPQLGQDTAAVLTHWLGLSGREVEDLVHKGTVTVPGT
jgi:formyl-CoA transferase